PRVGFHEGGLPPALDANRQETAVFDEVGEESAYPAPPGVGMAIEEPADREVVLDVTWRGDAHRARGEYEELALRVLGIWNGRVEHRAREDAFGEVVQLLDAATSCDRDHPGDEQSAEHVLAVVPRPAAAVAPAAAAVGEVGRCDRPARLDLREHRVH